MAKGAAQPGKESTLCPGKEMFLKNSKDLSPSDFRRLVERRTRRLFGRRQQETESEDRRGELEAAIEIKFEKIHKGTDLLPVSFLEEGAARAQAVCRISTPTSFGTGFLIAPGVLMTNNHVLGSVDEAASSLAQFDFEHGEEIRAVAIRPNDLFVTDADLDFTIVACDTAGIEDIPSIPLLRNPETATRNERVNIIQHPSGRRKEVALHDNRIVRVQDLVLRYRTDTEPGSSGSPVFNNAWEFVALHHAGVRFPDGSAENEGIRASAIVSHLIDLARGSSSGESLRRIVESVRGTSPSLGFFDTHGLGSAFEVQVNGFQGTPEFADIGFWNIEHFNRNVSNSRVEDVAEVLSTLSMDAMGLTEVQAPALDRLVDEMARQGANMDFRSINVSGSQDLAVLFDRNTTRVELRDELATKYADELSARTSDGKTAFPRRPLFAQCTVGDGDSSTEFLMIVVHLKAFGDAQSRARRRLAATKLAEIIADLRDDESVQVVLGGDFNERIDTDTLASLKNSPDLFSMTIDDASNDAISFVGQNHRSLIDHIIVSSDVKLGEIQGDDAAIVRLDRSAADFPDTVSDHVPVVFRMILRDEEVPADGPAEGPDATVDVPEGTTKLNLSFETT